MRLSERTCSPWPTCLGRGASTCIPSGGERKTSHSAPDLIVQRGNVLKLTGPQETVERGAMHIGPQIAPTTATDFIVLGFAIFLGGLAGALLRFNIAGSKS